MYEINKILDLVYSDNKKGYCIWENKVISIIKANNIVITFIKKLNEKLSELEENHIIMTKISETKTKTLEDENLLRWWNETMDFPSYSENTTRPHKEVFELHTKLVLTQTLLLSFALTNRRITY